MTLYPAVSVPFSSLTSIRPMGAKNQRERAAVEKIFPLFSFHFLSFLFNTKM
jgi:hypothetical protein